MGCARSAQREALSAPSKISDHVYWLPPGRPDKPSLCAVAGERRVMWLDAGSSGAHTRGFLDWLSAQRVTQPSFVAFTHSHWDHVFGGAELSAPVIAHRLTAGYLRELAEMDWSDEALEGRLAAGEVSEAHVEHVKEEMPSPREVRVAQADLLFEDGLVVHLGGVTVRIRHVGGDHAADSCVMHVEPDGVLFLGDCLYQTPSGGLTAELALPLHEAVLGFGADVFVEGHNDATLTREELEKVIAEERAEHGLAV